MNRRSLIIVGMVVLSCLLSYWLGKWSAKENRVYQTSEFQERISVGYPLLELLCKRHNIDIEDVNDSYIISCPKCIYGGARMQKSPTGSLYYGFHLAYPELEKLRPGESAIVSTTHSQIYCNKCLYPIGSDWKITHN